MPLMTEFIAEEDDSRVSLMGGHQRVYKFPNGYGASVIMGSHAYSDMDHPYELAVLGLDGHLSYTTPITSDVEGHLNADEVNELLLKIKELPSE
jgi:hypothetical protein